MKILIIRLSSLGDVALTFPAVNMLAQAHPDWEIDYLTHKPYVKLVQAVKGVRNVFALDKKGLGKLRGSSITDAMRTIKSIHSEEYDAVVDFHSYAETGLLASLTNAPLTVGRGPASSLYYEKHFGKRLDDKPIWFTHAQTLVFAGFLDESYLERIPEFFYVSEHAKFAEKVQNWFNAEEIAEDIFKLGLFISASKSRKCWDNESYLQFIKQILNNFESLQVIVIGSLDDESQQEEFLKAVTQFQNNDENFAEKVKFHWYSSPELLEIIEIDRKLDFFVSNDTGPYHLAVLSGVQTLGLFQKPLKPFFPPSPHEVLVAPDADLKKLKANVVSEAFNNLHSFNSTNQNKERI